MACYLNLFKQKMIDQGMDNFVIDLFSTYYKSLKKGEKGLIYKDEISAVEKAQVINYKELKNNSNEHLRKFAIIKLNGGLGTSMGLKKAKSLIKVKGSMSFLDIIVMQILKTREKSKIDIPIIFMNSFNTQKDTLESLKKYENLKVDNLPLDFLQNRFPKIKTSDLSPFTSSDDSLTWNPPGHGEIYITLSSSGILDKLLKKKIEYVFISNSDNLGAEYDPNILNYFASSKLDFLMEVCKRTSMDKKGGHLAQSKKSGLVLREIAQTPQDEYEEFADINLYKYFNTNNIWINLISLKKRLLVDPYFKLPLIVNKKRVDSTDIIQLETAMGAAISSFKKSKIVVVSRDRFVPVKKTNDLLSLWSDIYRLTQDYKIKRVPKILPKVELNADFYGTIKQLQQRVKITPSLKGCSSFTINSDYTFSKKEVFSKDIIL